MAAQLTILIAWSEDWFGTSLLLIYKSFGVFWLVCQAVLCYFPEKPFAKDKC